MSSCTTNTQCTVKGQCCELSTNICQVTVNCLSDILLSTGTQCTEDAQCQTGCCLDDKCYSGTDCSKQTNKLPPGLLAAIIIVPAIFALGFFIACICCAVNKIKKNKILTRNKREEQAKQNLEAQQFDKYTDQNKILGYPELVKPVQVYDNPYQAPHSNPNNQYPPNEQNFKGGFDPRFNNQPLQNNHSPVFTSIQNGKQFNNHGLNNAQFNDLHLVPAPSWQD